MRSVHSRTNSVAKTRHSRVPQQELCRNFGWRVWLPDPEGEHDEGNPCRGIAVAVLLSLPIWAVLALTIAVAV